jgi:hypothetical protein
MQHTFTDHGEHRSSEPFVIERAINEHEPSNYETRQQ